MPNDDCLIDPEGRCERCGRLVPIECPEPDGLSCGAYVLEVTAEEGEDTAALVERLRVGLARRRAADLAAHTVTPEDVRATMPEPGSCLRCKAPTPSVFMPYCAEHSPRTLVHVPPIGPPNLAPAAQRFADSPGVLRVRHTSAPQGPALAANEGPPPDLDVPPDECEGEASARWCPVHGTCTCPRDEEGGWARTYAPLGFASEAIHDPACPLHGPGSTHGEDPLDPETIDEDAFFSAMDDIVEHVTGTRPGARGCEADDQGPEDGRF